MTPDLARWLIRACAGGLAVAAAAAGLASAPPAAEGALTIITVAGRSSLPGYAGDGGPATVARLQSPSGLTFDSAGNLYILECARIRRVNTAGTITTIAGTGLIGYGPFGGDGGHALNAQFRPSCGDFPDSGLAADGRGNLYFADTHNQRIRKIDAGGIITTIAETGSAPGIDHPSRPTGVAVDAAGNVYYSDWSNSLVFRIAPAGTITAVAGNGDAGCGACPNGDGGPATAARIGFPTGLALDRHGNLYVADYTHHRVRRVNPAGIISTLAGRATVPGGTFSGDGGPAVNAELSTPGAVAVDRAGNVYIADIGNARIRRVDPAGTITTYAGTTVYREGVTRDGQPPTETRIGWASGLALDGGDILHFASHRIHHVRKVAPAVTGPRALPLPAARRCTRQRAFRIRVRRLRGIRFTSATVAVNGRRVPVYVYTERGRRRLTAIGARYLNVRRFRAFIDLRGLVKGIYTVRVTVLTADGRTLRAKGRYRTCASGGRLRGRLPRLDRG
jgi:sugar lactone lactonase YvrE